jgi:hypothetical protein
MLLETNEIDMGIYGLGDKRTLKQYEQYAGVDFKEKQQECGGRRSRRDGTKSK